ncbi:uncharacterized protein LOC123510341 isoform X1 [Portunus trituberculatus]|uniref:uncharacterized protein LOC123510341 isoform X1 n=1 Tax=Portunus trituberculatus TaxID=210409 RepID=UPI001E1CC8BC|nr:uncharacterized protein LOC123510341 isoform X1 [Portunus trituberculatus]
MMDKSALTEAVSMLQQASPVLLWRKEVVLWGTGVNSVWCLVVVLLCLLVALWLLRPNRHLPPGPWELPLELTHAEGVLEVAGSFLHHVGTQDNLTFTGTQEKDP